MSLGLVFFLMYSQESKVYLDFHEMAWKFGSLVLPSTPKHKKCDIREVSTDQKY